MHFNFLDHPRVRQSITILLLPGALAAIFPPQEPVFIWWADHAVYVAIGYLLLGLCLLMIHKTKLMFVCFGCSAAISFFHNETELIRLTEPRTGMISSVSDNFYNRPYTTNSSASLP